MTETSGIRKFVFAVLAAACGTATLFFAYFGARLVHFALTYEGEGSLGHVGIYIGSGLFPLLALLFGGLTILCWRAVRR